LSPEDPEAQISPGGSEKMMPRAGVRKSKKT
jgi:hypothetical protein